MISLVVPGTGETMAAGLLPLLRNIFYILRLYINFTKFLQIEFNKLDFPAFGWPIIAT